MGKGFTAVNPCARLGLWHCTHLRMTRGCGESRRSPVVVQLRRCVPVPTVP